MKYNYQKVWITKGRISDPHCSTTVIKVSRNYSEQAKLTEVLKRKMNKFKNSSYHRAGVFIGPVLTVDVAITENCLSQTLSVAALQLTRRTNRFIRLEVRLSQLRPCNKIAVVNTMTPVASLTINVEMKSYIK